MRRAAIDDQKEFALDTPDQALQKFDEDAGVRRCPFR
jgi:hypothetical protein